jgi:hypothetical protein
VGLIFTAIPLTLFDYYQRSEWRSDDERLYRQRQADHEYCEMLRKEHYERDQEPTKKK